MVTAANKCGNGGSMYEKGFQAGYVVGLRHGKNGNPKDPVFLEASAFQRGFKKGFSKGLKEGKSLRLLAK